jgi:hypothetical protein
MNRPLDSGPLEPLEIVILGLSITSSWGNGHATTYRGLVRELARRGHRVLFLEHDVPWYAENRDLPRPPYGATELYRDLADLAGRFRARVRQADAVILGSYVQQGEAVADWVLGQARGVTAFYDIDTPVTLAKLARGDYEYLHPRQIPCFDLYLSFTGGPTLDRLERDFGARRALPLFCSCDPAHYFPEGSSATWEPTATTASRRSTRCCSSRRGACPAGASRWPAPAIRRRSPGPPTWTASSTWPQASTGRSTTASAIR